MHDQIFLNNQYIFYQIQGVPINLLDQSRGASFIIFWKPLFQSDLLFSESTFVLHKSRLYIDNKKYVTTIDWLSLCFNNIYLYMYALSILKVYFKYTSFKAYFKYTSVEVYFKYTF